MFTLHVAKLYWYYNTHSAWFLDFRIYWRAGIYHESFIFVNFKAFERIKASTWYCFVRLLVIVRAAFAIFYKRTHKDVLHDISGCVLSHLPASVDIATTLYSSLITSLLHYISTIRSSVACCKLKIAKSAGKLKSNITNISWENKIAWFANISSRNKFPLYGINLLFCRNQSGVSWKQIQ